MPARYQTIVIGLGGIGSAVLYHMTKLGQGVLGIDQFTVPHPHGSTHGGTRITRLANGEGDFHTKLALRSQILWKEAQTQVGYELLNQCGGIIVSNNSGGSFNNTDNYFAQTLEAAAKFDIAHELWDAKTAAQKYPQLRFQSEETIYYEPGSGFLRPEACIKAHLELAQASGAEVAQRLEVLSIEETAHGIRLQTAQDTLLADQVILSAGPWIGKMLPEYGQLFEIIRQITFWFDVDDWQNFTPGTFPVFIRPSRHGQKGIYGFPAIDGQSGGIKIASEYLAKPTSTAAIDRTVHREEIEEIYHQDIQPHFNGVSPTCVHAATCVFTNTPDYGFVIDRHPQMKSLVIASPCSGYGFKFAPALGEVIAQFALNQKAAPDPERFSLKRLETAS